MRQGKVVVGQEGEKPKDNSVIRLGGRRSQGKAGTVPGLLEKLVELRISI